MAPSVVFLVLAQAISSTPAPVPVDGPPPPSIVERIGAPVASPTLVPTPAPTVQVAPAAPIPTAVPIAAPARTGPPPTKAVPAARSSAFGVHVGSYRKRSTAEAEGRRLGAELALPARVLEVDLGAKGVWFRTIVGEVGTAAEASALREQLKKKGIPDAVVQGFSR